MLRQILTATTPVAVALSMAFAPHAYAGEDDDASPPPPPPPAEQPVPVVTQPVQPPEQTPTPAPAAPLPVETPKPLRTTNAPVTRDGQPAPKAGQPAPKARPVTRTPASPQARFVPVARQVSVVPHGGVGAGAGGTSARDTDAPAALLGAGGGLLLLGVAGGALTLTPRRRTQA